MCFVGILRTPELESAVRVTIDALQLGDEDAAAAKAALMLAENIDAMTDKVYAMRWLVPELLKYLDALGATPAARAAIKKQAAGGENGPAAVSWLEQQRAARSTRSAKRP